MGADDDDDTIQTKCICMVDVLRCIVRLTNVRLCFVIRLNVNKC